MNEIKAMGFLFSQPFFMSLKIGDTLLLILGLQISRDFISNLKH